MNWCASTPTGSTAWPTGLSGNQHDAEDLTQETFIRVFRSVQNYQPGTFEGWLHRITTNLFLDMVRRRNRIRMEALPEDYERVPADEPNPEQIYHDSRLGPDLQAALDSLPRSSAPPSSCAISKVCPTRRSARRSASSSAPCAAASTAVGRRSATTWRDHSDDYVEESAQSA